MTRDFTFTNFAEAAIRVATSTYYHDLESQFGPPRMRDIDAIAKPLLAMWEYLPTLGPFSVTLSGDQIKFLRNALCALIGREYVSGCDINLISRTRTELKPVFDAYFELFEDEEEI